jgi:hypothetical protein
VVDLEAAWTVPVDLAILRESADPLGFASAADRLAALMCSPITGRTTSVRHLSMFCWVALTAEQGPGRRLNSDHFDRSSRILTISTTAVLQRRGSSLTLPQRRALTLPGRRRAGGVATRYLSDRLREEDFDLPLLGAEHAQGLWGTYASMARNLGLIEKVGGKTRLTPAGRKWANHFGRNFFPHAKPGWFSSPDIVENKKAVDKFLTVFTPHLWPLSEFESNGFFQLLDRDELNASQRITFLMGRAAANSPLSAISRNRASATLVGVDGTSLAHLAHLAHMATQAIRQVENPFRSRLLFGDRPPDPDLGPYGELIDWAKGQGLDIGTLKAGRVKWASLDRHHARMFRRRGRVSWPDLAKEHRLDIPPTAPRPDFRFTSLRRLSAECQPYESEL